MSRIETKLAGNSKARTCTGLTVWVSLVALTVLAALPIQRLGEHAKDAEPRGFAHSLSEGDLSGGYYVPANPKIADTLADWEMLYFKEGEITGVRMVGAFRTFGGERIDISTTQPTVLRTFERALYPAIALRPGVSDIGQSALMNGGGDNQGVFAVTTKDGGRFIIGIGQTGFYLGIRHGDQRQKFYSAALAKQVEELFFEATKKRIPQEHLIQMSGQKQIDHGIELFDSLRKSHSQ